jgi:hypothetical protein
MIYESMFWFLKWAEWYRDGPTLALSSTCRARQCPDWTMTFPKGMTLKMIKINFDALEKKTEENMMIYSVWYLQL